MKYILDTDSISFLMRGDPSVVRELSSRSRADIFLPQPAISEIQYGLARLPPSRKQLEIRERFALFCQELQRAPWTDDVSRSFGWIKADLERRGLRIEDFDVAVTAHALAADATLVTTALQEGVTPVGR